MEYRPSRAYVARIYLKRISRWRRNSWPFLSGDAFADLADVNVGTPRFRGRPPSPSEIRRASVVFCDSRLLEEMLSDHGSQMSAKVLIAGNSDQEFHSIPENLPSGLRLVLLQNSFISDGLKFRTLPIGIENLRWGMNGHPRLMKMPPEGLTRNHEILIGPLSPTHPIRRTVIEQFTAIAGPWNFINQRLEPKNFAEVMRQYEYVAAVRGNGVDTHRFWEALYRGSTPVVQRDAWSESLLNLGLPFEFIEEWTPEALRQIIEHGPSKRFNSKDINSLWMPYWKNLIDSVI